MSVMAAPGWTRVPRYPAVMATRQVMGIRAARAVLAERVRQAQDEQQPVHTVLMLDLQPRGVLVSMAWRRSAAAALNEPLELTQVPIVAVSGLRERLGAYVGEHVIVAKHNDLIAALVPWDWYVGAAKALGETVDI